ncbi:MAG TPA: response regulator [Chloroflexota bacterium]
MAPNRPLVLVVEDDPTIGEVLHDLLTPAGYEVECVTDGAAGLARIEQGGIDLVLLDVMLPELNGLSLARRVRARAHTSYLPIIMLTALRSEAQREAGFAAGADDYITKPFAVEELLVRIQVWLQARARLDVAYGQVQRLAAGIGREQEQLRALAERLAGVLDRLEADDRLRDLAAAEREELEAVTTALAARVLTLSQRIS